MRTKETSAFAGWSSQRSARRAKAVLMAAVLLGPSIASTRELAPDGERTGRHWGIGSGYFVDSQTFVPKCVEEKTPLDLIKGGRRESSFILTSTLDERAMAEQLSLAAGASARLGLVKVEGRFGMARAAKSSRQSLSLNWYSWVSPGWKQLGEHKLTADGEKYKQNGTFRQNCGDEYVSAIEQRAELFLSLRADFSSAEQRDEFNAKVKLETLLTKSDVELQTVSKQYGANMRLEVTALQVGGDPADLATALNVTYTPPKVKEEKQEEKQEEYLAVTSCSFGDFGACKKMFDAMIRYATQQFPA